MNAFLLFHPASVLLKKIKQLFILIYYQEFLKAKEILHYLMFPNKK